MKTYYIANRPSQEYIDKMLLKAAKVYKNQTEVLIDNGDTFDYSVNKRQFNKGFKKKLI